MDLGGSLLIDKNKAEERVDKALARIQEVTKGRQYVVGTKIKYRGKYGVVTDLNKTPQDVAASTVDLRLADGTTVEEVNVSSVLLEFFRA